MSDNLRSAKVKVRGVLGGTSTSIQQQATVLTTTATTGNRARVRRYRATHRRIDYAPSPDVLPIIEHHLRIGTDRCLAGVIDFLIRTAYQAIAGNGGR